MKTRYDETMPTFPELYEQHLVGPMFGPWAELLLAELRLEADHSLLDVACGTGAVPRTSKARHAVGVDLNPEMLDVAKSVAPHVEWRHGDATSLPLKDGEQFDAVVCQQGLQFVCDRQAALHAMKQALRPGGKLGIAIWRHDEEVPLFKGLREAAERTLGPVNDARHSFTEIDELRAMAEAAGFQNWRHQVRALQTEFPISAPLLKLNSMALIGMSGKELSEEDRAKTAAQIEADSEPVIVGFTQGNKLVFETRSNIFLATG